VLWKKPPKREKRKGIPDFFFPERQKKHKKKCWFGCHILDWEKYTNNPLLYQ